jgi:hypothetical protein
MHMRHRRRSIRRACIFPRVSTCIGCVMRATQQGLKSKNYWSQKPTTWVEKLHAMAWKKKEKKLGDNEIVAGSGMRTVPCVLGWLWTLVIARWAERGRQPKAQTYDGPSAWPTNAHVFFFFFDSVSAVISTSSMNETRFLASPAQ